MLASFVLTFLIFFWHTTAAQYNPHAGMVPSFTDGAKVTVSSTSPGSSAENVLDGKIGTLWQSEGALPLGFLVRPDLNLMLGLGSSPAVVNSGSQTSEAITDGDVYTAVTVPVVAGEAWVDISLDAPQPIRSISLKAALSAVSISVWVYRSASDSLSLGNYSLADNHSLKRFSLIDTIVKIRLVSSGQFSVSEVGVLSKVPSEFAVIDMGSVHEIGWIDSRHYSGNNVIKSAIYLSLDSVNWVKAVALNPLAQPEIPNRLEQPIAARYIKLEHIMTENDWSKAQIWEIRAYDKFGKYGPIPTPVSCSTPFSEMLGVNGIWGWGHNRYSDLLATGEGPSKFARVASHARNYHNLNWDITDPDEIPDFDNMPGSLAQSWLDWNREYSSWNSVGLDVFASIQFRNASQPEGTWNVPFQAAYNYGYAFASYFGPETGNGLVNRIEIGNEPWDYRPGFYRTVLQGMAEGAKAADSTMQVIPCALQAADSSAEYGVYKNYAGFRLSDSIAPFIDALNGHYFSYYNDTSGVRRATYPENYLSGMRAVLNDLRFRDVNFPGKKMVVSEWGWDSDGTGENCTHNECVTESEQAIYAIRAALMFSRLGIQNMTWFFYANSNSPSSLHARSGLTGSIATSFAEKKVFTALEALLHHIGNDIFLDVLEESDNHWVYLFGDTAGKPTKIVAWRPVDASDTDTSSLLLTLPYLPDAAWTISGQSGTGLQVATPEYYNGQINLSLSAVPLVVHFRDSVNTSISPQ